MTPTAIARAIVADLAQAVADACARIDTHLANRLNEPEEE